MLYLGLDNLLIYNLFMPIKKKTKYGAIDISNEAIASTVADAIASCYGVVGIAKKSSTHEAIIELLKNGSFSEGVFVSQDKRTVSIDLYIVIAFDVKITEVLFEVQKRVKYIVKKTFNIDVKYVNVYATSLKKVN